MGISSDEWSLAWERREMSDIGIYTSLGILQHKLEQAKDGKSTEATWNMARIPRSLGKGEGPDRLFFAVDGFWRGYFILADEVLYNPVDVKKPFSLIFDTTTWIRISRVPVKRFRGFRYLQGMSGSQEAEEE